MGVSICVGNYAREPYRIPGLEIHVYSMEELCYCLKENAFLMDFALLNDGLLQWIGRECGLRELADKLHPLVHRRGQLSEFAVTILRYVGFYDEETIRETERILKQGVNLSGVEKRKNQIDYMVRRGKYRAALRGYDELLQSEDSGGQAQAAIYGQDFLAKIWHNKGIACVGLMLYEDAAACFGKAYEVSHEDGYCMAYLAAKRMLLSEKDYEAFIAGCKEWNQQAQELEKRYSEAFAAWEQSPEYRKMQSRREQKKQERQKYCDESEHLVQVLKDNYRSS